MPYQALGYAKYPQGIPASENFNPSGFFGYRSGVPPFYGQGNAFTFPSGYSISNRVYNLLSNAHEYRSNDFNIIYSSGYKSFSGNITDRVYSANEVSLEVFLYKADNEID